MLRSLFGKEPLEVADHIDLHKPFSRFYLRALSDAADRSVPREAQFSRLMLGNTHMEDHHLDALSRALMTSFENNGPLNCSLALIEEIDISENHKLTSEGLTRFFQTLVQISTVEKASRNGRWGGSPSKVSPAARHLHALAEASTLSEGHVGSTTQGEKQLPFAEEGSAVEEGAQATLSSPIASTPLSPRAKSGDACNALWRINASQNDTLSSARTGRALATAVVQLLRLSRALFDVSLPKNDDEERVSLETAEASERAAKRTELILKRVIAAGDVDAYPTPHPLDDRVFFWGDDVPMNAAINKFPTLLKDRVLACMIRFSTDPLSMMNASSMNISDPTTIDDTQRTHPKRYSVDSAAFIAEVLSATSLVRKVDFSNNCRGDEAVIALSSFLTRNTSVVDLRLRSNNISTEGGLALAAAISSNKTLVELDLSDNSCSDVVANAFRDLIVKDSSRIGFVNWDRNCISPHLTSDANYQLMLNAQPRIVKDAIVRLTQRDPQMTRVVWNLSEPIITDDTIKLLMQSSRDSEFLTHIDVSNSRITDEGARHLADIVSFCPCLTTVVAQMNYITDEGALLLLHALPRSRSLERLDLRFQQPRSISTKLLESIEQVSNLGSQPYALRQHGLALVVNDPACTEIDLSTYDGERRVTDATILTLSKLMATNTNVRTVNLSKNKFRVTGKSIPLVASFATFLTKLDLSSLYLKDNDVVGPLGEHFLAQQPSPALQELNLSDNQLTRAASYEFSIIARNINDVIQTINFDDNPAISNQDKDVVDFYCGVNRYPKAFKNIILDVEANGKPQLTSLNFTVVERTASQGTSHRFAKEFGDHSVRLLCIALAQNSTVHKVIFSGNRCTDVGATYWAQLLRVNVTIQHLDISFNAIGIDGLTEIAEALEESHAVKVLGFEGNPGAKNVPLSKRLLAAVRRSALESSADRTNTFSTAHSVSNTHHAKALQLSLAQAAVVDKQIEDAIMSEAMAEYNTAKAKATYKKQQEMIAASQLARNKDASLTLAPLSTGRYEDGIEIVPEYLRNADPRRSKDDSKTIEADAAEEKVEKQQ